jgi:hypothetical protein
MGMYDYGREWSQEYEAWTGTRVVGAGGAGGSGNSGGTGITRDAVDAVGVVGVVGDAGVEGAESAGGARGEVGEAALVSSIQMGGYSVRDYHSKGGGRNFWRSDPDVDFARNAPGGGGIPEEASLLAGPRHGREWIDDVQYLQDPGERYAEWFPGLERDARPRELTAIGDTELIARDSVCICGARSASQEARIIAFKCARIIAEMGCMVVSGYARGIDLAAHHGALEADGDTMALLPHGLSRFSVRRQIRSAFDHTRFLAVSELPLTCGFMTHNALRRNTLMVAHARAVIVVEPGDSGGTWYTASQACKRGTPLFYHEGLRRDLAGKLKKLGGIRIAVRKKAPVLDEVLDCVQGS